MNCKAKHPVREDRVFFFLNLFGWLKYLSDNCIVNIKQNIKDYEI